MRASNKPSYEFGSFRLETGEYLLLRDGQVIPLTPKVFETLLVLVENSGHVVEKEELYKQVWQDAFVEDANLTKNISILRKILSEGDGEAPFIETVPKRGYRFVAPVHISHGEDGSTNGIALTGDTLPVSAAENIPSGIRTRKYLLASLFVIVAVVIAGGSFGYKFAFPSRSGISIASAQITRLTSSGTACESEISPDGKWLVYVENEGDHHGLWIKQIAVPGSAIRITDPIAGQCGGVAISPDGTYVYYTVIELGLMEASLYQVPVLGGTPPRKLFTGIIGPVTFSPDGKRIAYFHWINDEDRLMVANADGTDQRQLVARSGSECFINANNGPAWSPDGKTLLTSIGTYAPELSMTVAVVSPDDGSINVFTQQKFQQILDVAWVSDGQAALVTANEQFLGTSNKIWQIAYPTGEAARVTNDLNDYLTLSLSADSNVLTTVQHEIVGNLWIAPLDESRSTQITTGTYQADSPSWTPDGRVVYTSNSTGDFDLYMLDPSEGTPKRLTDRSGNNRSPIVSPDGRYVVFTSDRSGAHCLWRIDIDGSNAKQLTNHTSLDPSFSPDGRTVIYTSVLNKYQSSTIGIDGGEPRLLSDDQAFVPAFSPDGTQIARLHPGGVDAPFEIVIMPAVGGQAVRRIPLSKGTGRRFRWTPDGKAFIFPIVRNGVTNLWTQSIEGGEPKQITDFNSDLIFSFDVSRDGKQLVFSRGTSRRDVVMFTGIKH